MMLPRIIDEQHKGDPFLKLIEFDGRRYVLDEAALIEQMHRNDEEFLRGIFERRDRRVEGGA